MNFATPSFRIMWHRLAASAGFETVFDKQNEV